MQWPWLSKQPPSPDIGGHISTYASSGDALRGRFNHFFRGGDSDRLADLVFFKDTPLPAPIRGLTLSGASMPLSCIIFAKNYHPSVDCRPIHIHTSCRIFGSSLLWSMGLAPIMSIYQARVQSLSQESRVSPRRRTQGLVFCRRWRDG